MELKPSEIRESCVKAKKLYRLGSAVLKNASLCMTVHHVREYTPRIILIEQWIGVSGGVIGETL